MSESNICPYCGEAMANSRRVQCGKAECKRAYQNERVRLWLRAYSEEHGISYARDRYPEQRRALTRAYKLAHPDGAKEQRRALKKRRKAQRRGAAETERFLELEIYQRDGWRCWLCGNPVERTVTYPDPMCASLDHVQPLSRGGKHTRDNVKLAHYYCNVVRGAREPKEGWAITPLPCPMEREA